VEDEVVDYADHPLELRRSVQLHRVLERQCQCLLRSLNWSMSPVCSGGQAVQVPGTRRGGKWPRRLLRKMSQWMHGHRFLEREFPLLSQTLDCHQKESG
jgi:hypothetical protein